MPGVHGAHARRPAPALTLRGPAPGPRPAAHEDRLARALARSVAARGAGPRPPLPAGGTAPRRVLQRLKTADGVQVDIATLSATAIEAIWELISEGTIVPTDEDVRQLTDRAAELDDEPPPLVDIGAARAELWPHVRVRHTDPLTSAAAIGLVVSVPAEGPVPVRLVAANTVVDAELEDLETVAVVVAPRKLVDEKWGQVWEVAPGIGVDIRDAKKADFLDFVVTHLTKVAATPVGAAVLAQFDPRDAFKVAEPRTGTGAYAGLAVVISEPPKATFETMSVRGLNDKGGRDFGGNPEDKIPWIKFAAPPRSPQDKDVMIGPAKVTVEGVLGHGDFPGLQSFDVVLFHELMHAHLFQRRVTTRLRELGQKDKPPGLSGLVGIVSKPGAELEDAVEEALVVGLLGGKGVALSENAYRCQREYGLRASYKAVGIDETQEVVGAHGWDTTPTAPQQIFDALRAIGLTPDQARFVADGTLAG